LGHARLTEVAQRDWLHFENVASDIQKVVQLVLKARTDLSDTSIATIDELCDDDGDVTSGWLCRTCWMSVKQTIEMDENVVVLPSNFKFGGLGCFSIVDAPRGTCLGAYGGRFLFGLEVAKAMKQGVQTSHIISLLRGEVAIDGLREYRLPTVPMHHQRGLVQFSNTDAEARCNAEWRKDEVLLRCDAVSMLDLLAGDEIILPYPTYDETHVVRALNENALLKKTKRKRPRSPNLIPMYVDHFFRETREIRAPVRLGFESVDEDLSDDERRGKRPKYLH